ncbi:MAG: hypothetical protein H6622_12355 [Halobacteriovoraceae bacterium]|nr:hypothetical protein [Halobacteriovoraceae bacterium]
MIHSSSRDPVLIKKIQLRVWGLRDEIAYTYKQRSEGLDTTQKEDLIEHIRNEYEGKSTSPLGEITENSTLDDSEDEMAAALAAAESGEAESEDSGAVDLDSEEVVTIKQVRPKLPPSKFSSGSLILSEISMEEMSFFCDTSFLRGQSIVVEFLVPQNFILNGEVIFCRAYNPSSKIISETKHPYRLNLKFSFLKKGERTLLREFVKSIEPDIPEETPKEETANAGDLSDLDELDL